MSDGHKVRRQTAAALGGQFGPDSERRLIVELIRGDMLVMCPKGTRQRVRVAAADVYRFVLRAKAARELLERREKKAAARAAAKREAA